jgi:hypothetical protein
MTDLKYKQTFRIYNELKKQKQKKIKIKRIQWIIYIMDYFINIIYHLILIINIYIYLYNNANI